MKRVVWKNKSNKQLCVTIPSTIGLKEGDLVEVAKSQIQKIAYSGVVGDLFHYGHLHSIQFAKSIADLNVVGVLTDQAVAEYRAKPISNLQERKAILSSLNCIDRAMVQHSRDPTENLKRIHEEFPSAEILLVHGSDLKYVHGQEYIKKIQGQVVQHPYYERLSTVKIMNQIMQTKPKDIADFADLIEGKEKIDFEYEKGNKVIVSSKADTLRVLKPLVKKSYIEDMYIFTSSDWKNRKQGIMDEITKKFPNKIVIRSSATNEDTLENSMAGYFQSVLNVDPKDPKQLEAGIKEVLNSYKNKVSESSFNQVLVQSQSKGIVMSGVLFTRTLESNAPYYVINYDDATGETDTVTKGVENKTIKIARFTEKIPKKMQSLIAAVKELEEIIPKIGLDIEFAVNKEGKVIIFQVRPLTLSLKSEVDDKEVQDRIEELQKQFRTLSQTKEHLCGTSTIFADMPDWNPAEIIGDSPNHLDYSLYDYIITDSAWHQARTSQGYFNVDPAKLVVLFGNKPYIDVRNSFNSFVPSALSKAIRDKLVCFCLEKLQENPQLQDKVEFEVVYTCFDFTFDKRSKELKNFSDSEIRAIKKALVGLTNNLIKSSKKSIKDDTSSVEQMEIDRLKIKKDLEDVGKLLRDSKFLLDDCAKRGTVQFSRLARLGFIGKILLKSLVAEGIISSDDYDTFMISISTVATEISIDFKLMNAGKLSKEQFLKKYYHLRPGSYDITSLRYESNPELLKTIQSIVAEGTKIKKFVLDKKTEDRINQLLKKESLTFSTKELLDFARAALEAREYSKFEFTKNLSDAIELIALAGDAMGFSRNELAMLSVEDIFAPVKDRHQLTKLWKEVISRRTMDRELNAKVVLPPIIMSNDDFTIVQYYTPRPNYITQKTVKAELARLDKTKEIEGKVVMVENGDPGYDWIFTMNIAGLITKYGGVASHMSIRCAEFGIPAAIGCGVLYDQLKSASSVVLDCKSKKISQGDIV